MKCPNCGKCELKPNVPGALFCIDDVKDRFNKHERYQELKDEFHVEECRRARTYLLVCDNCVTSIRVNNK